MLDEVAWGGDPRQDLLVGPVFDAAFFSPLSLISLSLEGLWRVWTQKLDCLGSDLSSAT